jgi:hypothetical protein
LSDDHSHEPDVPQSQILKFKADIREKGRLNLERQARTFAAEAVDKIGHIMDLGPSEASLAAMVRRARIEAEKWIENIRGFTLPPPFKKNAAGEPWVIADTGEEDPERIVVVSSPVCQKALENVDHLFVDGTFDACPDSFYQLMTIHGIVAEIQVEGRPQTKYSEPASVLCTVAKKVWRVLLTTFAAPERKNCNESENISDGF